VLRGLVNHPSINGKDGVAGSIAAGSLRESEDSKNCGDPLRCSDP
jgi:hypothetical protein